MARIRVETAENDTNTVGHAIDDYYRSLQVHHSNGIPPEEYILLPPSVLSPVVRCKRRVRRLSRRLKALTITADQGGGFFQILGFAPEGSSNS